MSYRPTPADRQASNYQRRNSDRRGGETHTNTQIQVKTDDDADWAKPFKDHIKFDIEQVVEKRPDTLSRKFWVSTTKHIPPRKLNQILTESMPECSVYPLFGYRFLHNFDVKLHKPVRLDTFIWRCCIALEGAI